MLLGSPFGKRGGSVALVRAVAYLPKPAEYIGAAPVTPCVYLPAPLLTAPFCHLLSPAAATPFLKLSFCAAACTPFAQLVDALPVAVAQLVLGFCTPDV